MSSMHLCLRPILESIAKQSATSFSFRGEAFAFASVAETETKLRDLLYERCYMRRIDAPQQAPVANGQDHFLADLCAANAARSRWQTGWRIDEAHESGWISAQRDGLTRSFAPGEFITKEGPGMPLRPGATVDVYLAAESHHMQPGFYFAFGETVTDEPDTGQLLRFYWNLEAAGAPLLLDSLSTLLNRFQVPYRFKCLAHPAAYLRADSAVLFISRRWYQIAAKLLRSARNAVDTFLRADSPLFTKRLSHGLAFAEDPGGNQSFGMHRCAALARAILEVAPEGRPPEVTDITEALDKRGVSRRTPYLNPGSVDIYDFVS